MVKSVLFVKTYLEDKNHPTLKGIWKHLIAAMEWAKITLKRLKKKYGNTQTDPLDYLSNLKEMLYA